VYLNFLKYSPYQICGLSFTMNIYVVDNSETSYQTNKLHGVTTQTTLFFNSEAVRKSL
jgi:hypothetical protein